LKVSIGAIIWLANAIELVSVCYITQEANCIVEQTLSSHQRQLSIREKNCGENFAIAAII
jgi:hypothetical protein